MSFRFRLQRVLDLRQRSERDAATALVAAQDQADEKRASQVALEAARAELAARITTGMTTGPNVLGAYGADGMPTAAAPAPGASVGTLRNLSFLLDRLDGRVAAAAEDTQIAQRTVHVREDALRGAFRERRTLDRLRERHEEQWRADVASADRLLMDEIALSRFTQPAARRAGAEPSQGS